MTREKNQTIPPTIREESSSVKYKESDTPNTLLHEDGREIKHRQTVATNIIRELATRTQNIADIIAVLKELLTCYVTCITKELEEERQRPKKDDAQRRWEKQAVKQENRAANHQRAAELTQRRKDRQKSLVQNTEQESRSEAEKLLVTST